MLRCLAWSLCMLSETEFFHDIQTRFCRGWVLGILDFLLNFGTRKHRIVVHVHWFPLNKMASYLMIFYIFNRIPWSLGIQSALPARDRVILIRDAMVMNPKSSWLVISRMATCWSSPWLLPATMTLTEPGFRLACVSDRFRIVFRQTFACAL